MDLYAKFTSHGSTNLVALRIQPERLGEYRRSFFAPSDPVCTEPKQYITRETAHVEKSEQ
jgi:hypothetical protein